MIAAIPKRGTVFRLEVPLLANNEGGNTEVLNDATADATEAGSRTTNAGNLVFELHGSQFESRPVERATKKFKQHRMDLL